MTSQQLTAEASNGCYAPPLFSLAAAGSLTNCARAAGCAGSNYPFLTRKERDNETGLDYFLARYYSSTQGRFTSPDEFKGGPEELYFFVDAAAENPTFYAEIDNPQSLNKYQYTYNNPLRYTDPTGHCVGYAAILRPVCIKVGQKVIERATPYVAAGVGALAGAAARIGEGNTGDPSCPACGSSERMGQALMKNNNNSASQGQQQGQGSQSDSQSTGQNTPQSSKHDQDKKQEGRSGKDPRRDVGDANRVIREGKKYVDTDTGNLVYVGKKGHTVITDSSGQSIVTRNTYTKKQVEARVKDGRWEPQ